MVKKIKKNKKGFTLAELLIVVAIIAVLVAISIPIFNSQLEKSRDAVSVSNMRAAYAEVQTVILAGSEGQTNVKYVPNAARSLQYDLCCKRSWQIPLRRQVYLRHKADKHFRFF